MGKERKAFKDTIFGKIVGKAGNVLPDAIGIAAKAISCNPMGAVNDAIKALKGNNDPKSKDILSELHLQFKNIELEFEKIELEETRLILADKSDARKNRIKGDWVFNLVVIFGLFLSSVVIYAIIFITIPESNKDMFLHLVGMVEGVILVKIFEFFLGTSRDSNKKIK